MLSTLWEGHRLMPLPGGAQPGIRVDPGLQTPVARAAPPLLEDAGTAVAVAAAAGPGRFLVAGAQAAAGGTERNGVESVRLGARLVAGRVQAHAGSGANVLASPGLLRRELVGDRGVTLETVLAPPALPAVAMQWMAPSGAPPPAVQDLSIHILPGAADVRYAVGEAGVRAVDAARDDVVVEVCVHPTPRSWSARQDEGGGLRLTAALGKEAPVTLVLAAGPTSGVGTTVSTAWTLDAHAVRVVHDADPRHARTLALATGAPEVDRAWVWATSRVRAALGWATPGLVGHPGDVFWTGIGALAIGDDATAAAALGLLEECPVPETDPALGAVIPTAALATVLAARTALTLGDVAPALRHARRLRAGGLDEARRRSDTEGWALWGFAMESLADALHHAADPETLKTLRSARTPTAGSHPPGAEPARLPMLGVAAEVPSAAYRLRALLGGPGGAPHASPGPGGAGMGPALSTWSALVSNRPDEGYAAWRGSLGDGLRGAHAEGGGCRGAWDPANDLLHAGSPGAGILTATLAHGLLGVAPDAPAGRLGLAPTLPTHSDTFQARNIRVGEVRVALEYHRNGPTHRFVLIPLEGRVPPMVVFEPAVAVGRVHAVRVDGRAAELDTAEAGGRTRVRVQLPLDGVRVLEIDCG
jgi:hypothetical protein